MMHIAAILFLTFFLKSAKDFIICWLDEMGTYSIDQATKKISWLDTLYSFLPEKNSAFHEMEHMMHILFFLVKND